LRRAKLGVEPELVTHGEFMTPGGYAAGALLLDLPDRPTAIFASSDLQAAGVYEAARERDVKIPSELSVVGFDDTAICGYLSPSLTSVRQPLADMAAEAIRLIFELGDNPSSASGRRIELATSLVVRDSATPLPAR
jgi:DNA-binding LacI/PurR family transcriptional regulator